MYSQNSFPVLHRYKPIGQMGKVLGQVAGSHRQWLVWISALVSCNNWTCIHSTSIVSMLSCGLM